MVPAILEGPGAPTDFMFDRFIRFAEARRALQKGHFEQVLRLTDDPLVRGHRRADELRDRALRELVRRARRRIDDGALTAAWSDVGRVLAADPDRDEARALQSHLQCRLDGVEDAGKQARELVRQAQARAEVGDLQGARGLLGTARQLAAGAVTEQGLEALVDGRARSAAELVQRAREAVASGNVEAARDALIEARSQDHDVAGGEELALQVARACAPQVVARARELHQRDDAAGAFRLLEREIARLPELSGVTAIEKLRARCATRWLEGLKALLKRGELEAAVSAFRRVDPRLPGLSDANGERAGLEALAQGLELRDRGDLSGAAESLAAAERILRVPAIARQASELADAVRLTAKALDEARSLAAEGAIVEARRRLLAVLEKWPMQEAVRREMEILDQGAQDREQRMARARLLAKEGKLTEASAVAVSLAVPGPLGEDARLLLKDVQARMDLVNRGLDQVRRAVHGRDSGTTEGVRHCLLRLEQLEMVCCDHGDMATLKSSLHAELEGLQVIGRAREALDAERPHDVAAAIVEFRGLQARLLRPDRLEARLLEVVDDAQRLAESAADAGRLTVARAWLKALEAAVSGTAAALEEHHRLQARLLERERRGETAANDGFAALERRDFEAAEASLERARAAANDIAPVRRLEQELCRLRGRESDLAEVERLTAKADFGAAAHKLRGMPPTPPMLRTRIFDLKQNLARAQGLDAGFLLRVDEGGEFLVLRGDSLTIGNVREGSADLAVLANVAGRHARLTRSMSFHGGMQDRIVAERGEVTVDGKKVQSHALRSGDRFRLGATLELVYTLPSARSLTALLTLRGGYQVAGTDKVLVMKDRGRDGRILIGAAKDAHVRVPHPGPVEIFSNNDGQVRVRCEGGGEMNGQPFSGEHPITAGALVRCGEIAFVLQPVARPS